MSQDPFTPKALKMTALAPAYAFCINQQLVKICEAKYPHAFRINSAKEKPNKPCKRSHAACTTCQSRDGHERERGRGRPNKEVKVRRQEGEYCRYPRSNSDTKADSLL